jgi:hypothetical protein
MRPLRYAFNVTLDGCCITRQDFDRAKEYVVSSTLSGVVARVEVPHRCY